MTSKHTPGPWHVDLMHRGDIQTLDGRDVCSVWSAEDVGTVHTIGSGGGRFVPDEDCDANAHLIAAAPEMYEALENLLGFDGNGSGGLLDFQAEGGELGFQSAALANAIERANAALSKARGEA